MTVEHPHLGKRVMMVRCTDPHTRVEQGTFGTVSFVDSMGTVHVKFDNGIRLGMIKAAGDEYMVVEGGKEQ